MKKNIYINTSVILTVLLSGLIATSGLIRPIGLIYTIFSLAVIFLGPIEAATGIVLINMVYFTYSYIDISYISGLSNIDYINICNMAFLISTMVKFFASENKKIRFKRPTFEEMLFIIFALYFIVMQSEISWKNTIYLICLFYVVIYIVDLLKKDKAFAQAFTIQFVIILFSVFLYNLLQMNRYATTHYYWVANRFTGVRDPNNFSLQCNLCILLCIAFLRGTMENLHFYCLVIVLTVGSLITLSISGGLTTLVIVAYLLFIENHSKVSKFIITLLVCFVVFLIISGFFQIDDASLIGQMVGRINNVLHAIEAGDYYSATTTRTGIWDKYLVGFRNYSDYRKLFGSPQQANSLIQSIGISSHNNYIDILINYGYIGLSFFLVFMLVHILLNVKKGQTVLVMINIVMIVNMFFRSMSGFLCWFGIII